MRSCWLQKKDGKVLVDDDHIMIKKQYGPPWTMPNWSRVSSLIRTVFRGYAAQSDRGKGRACRSPVEIIKTQVKAKIKISSQRTDQCLLSQERDALKKFADAVIESGANVLFCQKGIADAVGYYLAKAGVLAVEDVPEKDMKFAALALNAEIVNKAGELTKKSLGSAALVEQVRTPTLSRSRDARTRRHSPSFSGAQQTTSWMNSSGQSSMGPGSLRMQWRTASSLSAGGPLRPNSS